MSHILKYNVADQIAYFRAYDTDGTAKTDLDSSTTGLTLSVFRVGASSVSIASLSDKAADDSTHADGAIRSVGGNLYTIDIPDAATATQVPSIVVRGSYTGGVVEGLEHPIVAYDPAVNYASATKAADIETDTQDIQNRLPATLNSGRMVSYVEDVATAAQDQIADAVASLNPSGKGADTLGGQIARTYTNSEEAEIIIGAIVQDTIDIQNRLPAALVGGRMDSYLAATANNVITHNTLATNCISNSQLATSAINAIQSGLATSAELTTVEGKVDIIDTIVDKLDTTVELDGAVYRFTENALEQAPTGGGGGTTIIPAASFAPARTDTTNLIAYIGETISQVLVVYEADGTTPLDLSGKTLTVVFEDMETGDTGVVASASVTVSGDNNNIVTFAYPSAVTDEIGQFRYALRDEAAPKTVYSQGLLLVKAAANKD
jgi:hypothetical protein